MPPKLSQTDAMYLDAAARGMALMFRYPLTFALKVWTETLR